MASASNVHDLVHDAGGARVDVFSEAPGAATAAAATAAAATVPIPECDSSRCPGNISDQHWVRYPRNGTIYRYCLSCVPGAGPGTHALAAIKIVFVHNKMLCGEITRLNERLIEENTLNEENTRLNERLIEENTRLNAELMQARIQNERRHKRGKKAQSQGTASSRVQSTAAEAEQDHYIQ